MDDVLVDFSGHIKDRWKKNIKDFKEWRTEIPGIENYWENIPARKDAAQLVSFLKPFDWHILSAYAEWDPRSKAAKKVWCMKHFNIHADRVLTVVRKDKVLYATNRGKPSILIDDYDKNIKEWKEKGGIGILHTSTSNTITKLKSLGFR